MPYYKVAVHIPECSAYAKIVYEGSDKEVALELAKAYARAGKMVWFEMRK